jgi:hypothetical protein
LNQPQTRYSGRLFKINLISTIILFGFALSVFYHYVASVYFGNGYPSDMSISLVLNVLIIAGMSSAIIMSGLRRKKQAEVQEK